ncbi:MAG: hypothetical protein NVSMB29_18860 [Candidatus Dormibacteria bacterium]
MGAAACTGIAPLTAIVIPAANEPTTADVRTRFIPCPFQALMAGYALLDLIAQRDGLTGPWAPEPDATCRLTPMR